MEDEDYENRWLQASQDLVKLQANYRQLQNVNESLQQQIENLSKQQAMYLSEKQQADAIAHAAELKLELMQRNALIDKRAREGQVKRMRIIEHQMKDILAVQGKERQQLIESEEQTHDLTKALNRERAQRLYDLHKNFRVASESLAGTGREKAMEYRCVSAEKDVELFASKCNLLRTALIAQECMNDESLTRLAKQGCAIEWGSAQRLMLKSVLKEARNGEQKRSQESEELRNEIYRLRTNLIHKSGPRHQHGLVRANKQPPRIRFTLPVLHSQPQDSMGQR